MKPLLDLFKTMEYGPAPESPAAVNAWLEEHGRKFGLFINNKWMTPKGSKNYSSFNPATGDLLAETAQAEKKDVDAAIAAARTAFESWSETPGVARARYMYAIARNVQKHSRLLAVLESRWTMANPSASRGMWTCPCWHVIFTITQVGHS